MAKTRRKTRWLKETSDISGFDNFDYDGVTFHKKWTSIDKDGLTISPEDINTPPPSTTPLGGADITGTPRTNSQFTTVNAATIPTASQRTIVYVNSSTSISWNREPWTVIVGSNVAQVMSNLNPQIVAGQQGQILALQCVGSSVTLFNSSGITIDIGRSLIRMDSGGIGTFFYNATDSTWHLTSFNENGGFAV